MNTDTENDLKHFVNDHIAEKRWSLRAYCRDTGRKLGQGKGIPVATLSFLLRGKTRISTGVVRKLAEYHDIPVSKALQMAGYYEAAEEPNEQTLVSLIELREQARSLVQRLDAIINTF